LIVVGLAAFVETDDPDVLLLQLFEGADEIDDAGDAQMFGGAGTGLDGDGTERGCTALSEHDAVYSGAIGYAQQSAKILRVFNAVESEEKAGGSGDCGGEEVFDGEKLLRVDQCYYALVSWGLGELGQLLARFLANAHARRTAEVHKALDAGVLSFAGDENVIKTAATGFEGFFDRMQPVENFHSCKCRRWAKRAAASNPYKWYGFPPIPQRTRNEWGTDQEG
jgi:hypothetical protein